MKYLLSIVILLGVTVNSFSQESASADDLLFYADVMSNAFEAENRLRAGEQFHALFSDYISNSTLNDIEESPFSKYISVLKFPDKNKALITWQIRGADETYDFKGFYFDESGQVTEFNRTEPLSESMSFTTSSSEDWYGAWYYDIMKIGEDKYLIFGIDANGAYDNQRIVDVLRFEEEGMHFGEEIFEDKESPGTYLNRLIISYSSDASVTVNYNPGLEVIIHDHLQPRLGLQAGQGATNIPDGTYEGYHLKDGKWLYKEKIFDHVYEEDHPPIPKPVKFNKTDK